MSHLEDLLRDRLSAVREPELPALLGVAAALRRRHDRRRRLQAAATGGGVACAVGAVLLASTLLGNRTSDVVSVTSSPTIAANSHSPAQAVVDGVSISGLPDGFVLVGSPHSQDLHPGTLTRQDVVVGRNGEGGAAVLRVYRDSDWPLFLTAHDVQEGNGYASSTTVGDDHRGIVEWAHEPGGSVDHRTGYVRLGPSVILIVSSSAVWDDQVVTGILESARLI